MNQTRDVGDIYEELSETSRRQILSELRSGPRSVNELVRLTGLKQPNVSNHLARMRSRGIVNARKVGRQVFYGLGSPEIESILMSVFSRQTAPETSLDLDTLSKQYAKAAVQGDEQVCVEVLDTVFRAQMPLLDIYQDLLAPAMTMIGIWYKVEAIDEGQEHLASAITERMMARASQIAGPLRRHGLVAVLGCAPDSYHVIGLRMIGDYMRLCGWKVLFLGANTPVRSFHNAVSNHKPAIVMLSCGAEASIGATTTVVESLAKERTKKRNFLIAVGGAVATDFEQAFKTAGADIVADRLRDFAETWLPKIEGGDLLPPQPST